MWLRGRWLSYVGVMLVVPLGCEAQGRLLRVQCADPDNFFRQNVNILPMQGN